MSEPKTDQLFDLSLTEEQRITRENIKRFAESEISSLVRAADEAGEVPSGFYEKTMELGLGLLPIPEEFGGAGVARSPMSNVLNAEDLGQGDISLAIGALTPLAFINTVIDQGTRAQQEAYLPTLADESFKVATIALQEPRATFEPSDLHTTAKKQGVGYVISGEKSMVALATSAEFILVAATLDNGEAGAFVVKKGAEGVSITKEQHMGLRPLEVNRVKFENVQVDANAKLGEDEKTFDLERLVDLSRLGLCALAVGCCQAVLDYVIPYVNDRVAFGEPIANRQSVAFMVSNIAIELDGMRLLVYKAASRAEQGLDFHKEAFLARVLCAEKAMEIGTNGVQLLGGHGYTREHPVELWYRNLRSVGLLEGVASI